MTSLKRTLRDLVSLVDTGRRVRDTARFVRTHHVEPLDVTRAWRALVLAPHPDDESIGCGGLIKAVTNSGGRVDVLYMTDGGAGVPASTQVGDRARLVQRRRAEAERACEILGVRAVDSLAAADGELAGRPDLAGPLAERLGRGGYEQVLCPWPYDRHPDHEATFRLLQRASRRVAPRTVLLFEAWTALMPNTALGIDAVLEAKQRAIAEHTSQTMHTDYVSTTTALARYRSLCVTGAQHAEAFVSTSSRRLDLIGSPAR